MKKPVIAITIGDPAGIGPEITRKALLNKEICRACRPFVIGDISRLKNLKPGFPDKHTGRASCEYIFRALELIGQKKADALVTAPISKEAIHLAGIDFPGHTEMLAAHTRANKFAMMMMAGRLRTIMVTRHIPVSAVGRTITPKGIVEAACLGDQFLKKYEGIDAPRIGICALNPHAGEAGLIGREEVTVIRPAIVKLRQMRINCEGPLPADSAWQRHAAGEFDMLITMYHDQAMIPLKCIAPDKIVNITAGLPFIRTSPGHGTAFNIAGKNKADPRPMIEAILCAARFSQARLARQ